jgi:ribosomal 30S subunit maturation factor RimM
MLSGAAIVGPGAHDLLKILLNSVKAGDQSQNQQQQQQQTMLLPFVKEFVPSIDEENRTIHICPPPGLLELALAPPSKGKKGGRNKAQK